MDNNELLEFMKRNPNRNLLEELYGVRNRSRSIKIIDKMLVDKMQQKELSTPAQKCTTWFDESHKFDKFDKSEIWFCWGRRD